MVVPWGLLAFVVGLLYGWLSPGRQRKGQLLKSGVLVGVALALVLVILGLVSGASPLGLGVGALGLTLSFLVLSLLFIVGVWLGDLIEGAPRKSA